MRDKVEVSVKALAAGMGLLYLEQVGYDPGDL